MRSQRGLSIGELARASGVNLETIRYYERIGLMAAPARTPGGHRLYEGEHRRRLAFIRRARDLGFSIDEIRALLDLSRTDAPCADVRALAAGHLVEVRAKIVDLMRLEKILTRTIDSCHGVAGEPDCAVLDMLDGAVDLA